MDRNAPPEGETLMAYALHAPLLIKQTAIRFDPTQLEIGTCGLFRAPLHLAAGLMPEMANLIDSVPVARPENYELDIKVHMLMAGQYPCIPNWHTDMVPRPSVTPRFDLIDVDEEPMLLWISDGPETEFLRNTVWMPQPPRSHRHISEFIRTDRPLTKLITPNSWYAMDQRTPHRGTQATKSGWRVFARVTPKSIAPQRPVHSVIRRHAQVYIDASEFSW